MQPTILTAALALFTIACFSAAAHAAWRLARLIKNYRKENHYEKSH
ncbi:hypothetical protein ES703_53463 [subsurface metagenome]